MATEIDKKIIEMELRNRQFEAASKDTMNTLDSLKAKLDFRNAADSMGQITSAANKVNMSGLERSILAVGDSFNAMSVVAFTVLQRITNAAIDAGSRIISALTINPITDGFREYETKMNSVQTILANTQSRAGKASASTIRAINAEADAAIAAIDSSTTQSAGSSTKAKTDALNALRDLNSEQTYELRKTIDEERDILRDAQDQELTVFEQTHDMRMAMLETEYKAKLKSLGIEEDAEVGEIDLQIKAIKDKQKLEREARDEQSQKDRIRDLKERQRNAKTAEERKAATRALNDYKEQLSFQQAKKEQELAIASLEEQKKQVKASYDEKEQLVKMEYDSNKAILKSEYDIEKDNIRAIHKENLKNMQLEHDTRTRNLQKEQDLAMRAAQAQYASSGGGGSKGASKKSQLAAIEAERVKKIADAHAAAGMTQASTLDDVNEALEELNKYSDKTIYNFANMTQNIGRFTAAGVNLDDSVTSIKGISNVAALSGSNAIEAARAMHQLSQALSSGTVRLEDWRSVEEAGMGGATFQQELQNTAREHGIAVDQMIAKNGSFRLSLQEEWLTTEVLLATLTKFTGDLTEEMLIAQGYTAEEAKRIYELGQNALEAATNINTFSQLIGVIQESLGSGWAQSWEIIIGDFGTAKKLFTGIGTTLQDMIGKSAEARNQLFSGWVDMGGRDKILDSLLKIFENFINITTTIKEAWNNVFPPITTQTLMNITDGFASLVDNLTFSEEGLSILGSTFEFVFGIFNAGIETVKKITEKIKDLVDVTVDTTGISTVISEIATSIKNFEVSEGIVDAVGTAFDRLGTVFTNLFETIKNFDVNAAIDKIVEGFKSLPGKVTAIIENHEALFALFGGGALAAGGGKLIEAITGAFKGDVGILENVSNVFEELTNTLTTFQSAIKANTISQIAKSILLLAGALFVLALLDQDALNQGVSAVVMLIGSLTTAMVVMGKMTGSLQVFQQAGAVSAGSISKQTSFYALAAGILAMAVAVGILAAAAAVLSFVPLEDTISNIMTLMVILVGGAVVLSKYAPSMFASAAGVLTMSIALGMLVIPLTALGLLPVEVIQQGLMALAGLMLEIGIFAMLIQKANLLKASVSLIAISISLGILTGVLVTLGILVVPATLGLIALIPLLFSLALAMKMMNNVKVGALSLMAVGVAVSLLTASLVTLMTAIALTDIQTLFYALLALGGIIGVLGLAAETLDKSIAGVGALIGLAFALNLMVGAVMLMSTVDIDKMLPSILALGGLVLVLAAATQLLSSGGKGVMALIGMAAAIVIIAGAFAIVSVINLDNIWTFIGAFTALVAAVVVAGAISGIPLVAAGLVALTSALLGIAGAVAVFAAGCLMIVKAITELAELGSEGANSLMDALIAFTEKAPELFDAIVSAVIDGINVFNKRMPEMVDAIINLIKTIIITIIESVPKIIAAGGEILTALLNPLLDGVGDFLAVAGQFIANILQGIFDGLISLGNAGIDITLTIVNGIKDGITKHVPALIKKMLGVGKDLVQGVIDGVRSMLSNAVDSVKDIGSNMLSGLKDLLGIKSSKEPKRYGQEFDQGISNGIMSKAGLVESSARSIGRSAVQGLEKGLRTDTDVELSPVIAPVLDISETSKKIGLFQETMDNMRQQSDKMEGTITTEETIHIVVDTTNPIRVEGVNNKDELVAVTNTYLDGDKLAKLIRRERRI